MKETTKMSRAIGQLEKIYNSLNTDLFSGALPVPIITVQSKPGTYGHCTTSKVWRNKESQQYEMNIAAEMLSMEIEEVLDTIIHEMIHLYCRENGIQEVSRGGKYHNRKFKAIAEEKGLVCYKIGQYGWNTQGHNNDKLTEYALEKGWSEIKINREGYKRINIPTEETQNSNETAIQQEGGRRTSSTRKYQCPCCKNSVRATKAVNIICGDCMKKMEIVK